MKIQARTPIFILAGGLGTRISEETLLKPKPMIEIGDIPILIHLMRSYYAYGFSDFVICAGYRAWEIKEYFLNYQFRLNHLMIDHREVAHMSPTPVGENEEQEKWRVRVIDTGLETMTGARISRALDFVRKTDSFENFGVAYGDGLSNVNLCEELEFHLAHQCLGTLVGVPPFSRFGELGMADTGHVQEFLEKPAFTKSLISAGFFFFKKEFSCYLSSDASLILEREPLEKIAAENQLKAFVHRDFWQCMDTLRDKNHLQALWDTGQAPWMTQFKKVKKEC